MFVTWLVTFIVAFTSLSVAASDDSFLHKLWEKVTHSRNFNETSFTKLSSNAVLSPNLRASNVEAQNTAVGGYLQITTSKNPFCSEFLSRAIGRIGTCVKDGKTSERIDVDYLGNYVYRLKFNDFSDGNCRRRKSQDILEVSPYLCYTGVHFDILPEFPSSPPPGWQGSAAWLHYARKSQCQSSNVGQPIFAEIYSIGDCSEGDEDFTDLKVTSCSSKEIRYHTYSTRKGTCKGKIAVRKWDKKDKCGNLDTHGKKSSYFIDHLCG